MSGILNNIYNNTNLALNQHMEALIRLQEQVSTGSRIGIMKITVSINFKPPDMWISMEHSTDPHLKGKTAILCF